MIKKIFNPFKSNNKKPFIVAEISGNHGQSIKKAKKLVLEIAKTGAHAIKLQTYKPETMTFNIKKREFFIKNKKNLWKGSYLFDLYKKAYTPWEWHKEIFDLAKKNGLLAFSSVFDDTSISFLKKLNNPIFKISSFENTDIELIKNAALTKKPIIISSGLASLSELNEAVNTIKKFGNKKFAILKCTSAYPATEKDINLKTILDIKKKFKCIVGFSDHTKDIYAAIGSVAQGAQIIEKHVKLDDENTVDSKFAINCSELKKLVDGCNKVYDSVGKIFYGPTKNELKSLKSRRTLFFNKDLPKNTVILSEHIIRARPGLGLKINNLKKIIGKKLKKKAFKGSPVKKGYF